MPTPTVAYEVNAAADGHVVAVACSGGRDSMALLHATLHCTPIAGLRIRVVALHVHHGLSPNADAWLAHVERQCAGWARRGLPVVFDSRRLHGLPSAGESIEAWARSARYAALSDMALAHGASVVLLAHHQRDQAETWLLQGLRGAGAAGLSAMPSTIERDGLTWARPWLAKPREAIDDYVIRHRISHVDDESNSNDRFARNRLRLAVWPALTTAFPDAEASLARSAAWSQEAAACLAELAALDLSMVASDGSIDIAGWRMLSRPRQSNALRAWMQGHLGQPAPTSLVSRMLDEVPASTSGARWPVGQGLFRRQRNSLVWSAETMPIASDNEAAIVREPHVSIRRAGRIALPGWGGALRVSRVREGGVPLAWLARVELRERIGGERFQAGIGRPPRSLKKQFQAESIGAWERSGPLVFSGGILVFVPGLGIDARVTALPGQPQVTLAWEPLRST